MSASVAAGLASGVRAERAAAGSGRSRVLLTGFDTPTGRAVADAFATAGARLVVQADATTADVETAVGRLAGKALSVSLVATPFDDRQGALAVTRSAIGALGGIDSVVVVLDVSLAELADPATAADPEGFVAGILRRPYELVQAAAARMDLTWTRGSVVVVLQTGCEPGGRASLLASFIRAGLAGLVRREAERFAAADIGVFALVAVDEHEAGPCTPEFGALAVALARRSDDLPSGLVYEAVTPA